MFSDIHFPHHLSLGAIGGPMFVTDVITTTNGKEQRNINWQIPKNYYELSSAIKNVEDLNAIVSFFRLHKGKAKGFRFKDWTDYQVKDQILKPSSKNSKQYQLIKQYKFEHYFDTRIITKPVPNSVEIIINNSKETNFNCDYQTGIITFDTISATAEVKASFEFDMLVRFDMDELKINPKVQDYESIKINLIEIKE